jgi:hypothetical protein
LWISPRRASVSGLRPTLPRTANGLKPRCAK